MRPISGQDIIRIQKGTGFEAHESGYFMTDKYFAEILKVKAEA